VFFFSVHLILFLFSIWQTFWSFQTGWWYSKHWQWSFTSGYHNSFIVCKWN